jgi:hypothetical protein
MSLLVQEMAAQARFSASTNLFSEVGIQIRCASLEDWGLQGKGPGLVRNLPQLPHHQGSATAYEHTPRALLLLRKWHGAWCCAEAGLGYWCCKWSWSSMPRRLTAHGLTSCL